MFESFYGFTAPPFQLNPDPTFYFGSRGHSSAHRYLRFGVFQGEGFIVVTGDIGAGKTTLVRALLAELDSTQVTAAQLVSTQLEANDLLRAVSTAFGVYARGATKAELLGSLEAFFISLAMENRRALLVVDEAQNLEARAIEELRMLSNFQLGSKALLQSFLVGQPELRQMLRSPIMEQLRQRVIASCHLGPMDQDETRGYVEHRLRRVGWVGNPQFEPHAFDAIYHWTGGVPRRINLLCNRLLLGAFLESSHVINAEHVDIAAREIRGEIGGTNETPDTGAGAAARFSPAAAEAGAAPLDGGPIPVVPAPFEAQRAPVAVPQPLNPQSIAPRQETPPWAVAHEVEPGLPQARPAPPPLGVPGPLLCVAGSTSSLLKLAPLVKILHKRRDLPGVILVDAGIDRSKLGNPAPWKEMGIAEPELVLALSGGSANSRAADVMKRIEPAIDEYRPSGLLIEGDGNEALSAALVASRKGIPVVHIEAGLRSLDRSRPGEINRLLLDQIADILYTSDPGAILNLSGEGIPGERIHCFGNLWTDAVAQLAGCALDPLITMAEAGVDGSLINLRQYGVVILRGQTESKQQDQLRSMLSVLRKVNKALLPLLWIDDAFVSANVASLGLDASVQQATSARLAEPGLLALLGLLSKASCVFTDSGEVQDQATAIGVPCLTLLSESDRPVTLDRGTNTLVGTSIKLIMRELAVILDTGGKRGQAPEFWDGKAAERIANHLAQWLDLPAPVVEPDLATSSF
jgi:UDP-N-acetylglucosamine 2-epimerase